jgi:hypothetical protein
MTDYTTLLSLHAYKSIKAAAMPPANPIPLPPAIFIIAAAELDEVGAVVVGDNSDPVVVGASVVDPPVDSPLEPVVVAEPAVAPLAVVVGAADPEVEEQTTWSGTTTGGSAVAQMVFA